MKTHLADDQRVVGVAVSAVEAARDQRLVQQGSPGDYEIQLVPVARPGMHLGHLVIGLCQEECVGETQVMEAAELQEMLASLVELADAKAANAARQGVVVTRALKSPSRNMCSLAGICWILASSFM